MIREATLRDAESILAIYSPYVKDSAISFEVNLPSLADFQSRMSKVLETHPWLVYEDNGKILGYAYASAHSERAAYQWSANVSVYIAKPHHKKGIGKKLYSELLQRLRNLGFYNAFGGITLPNPGSVGLHESFGFSHIGTFKNVGHKFGQWHDVGWWQLQLRPLEQNPTPL